MEHQLSQVRVLGGDERVRTRAVVGSLHHTFRFAHPPRVAEPQRREQVHRRRVGAAVGERDAHQHVFGTVLRVLDVHIHVAVVVEHARVEQLVLEVESAAGAVRGEQVVVGELDERVLVPVLEVRARRRGVEVEVVLLHVLPVVALGVGQPEGALLEDRVGAVPQRDREAQQLAVVAQAGDAVLTPLVGPGPGLVVGEVAPRITVVAVVLPDRAPLALAQVGAPSTPRNPGARLGQPVLFDSSRHWLIRAR